MDKLKLYSKDAVTFMKLTGIIKGYINDYRPHDNLTREEAEGYF